MAKSSSIGFLVICLLLATFFSAIHCWVPEGGKSRRDEEGPGERMLEKDLRGEDGKPGKDWGSRGGWESEGGGGKDWGSGGHKQGKDWGSKGGNQGRHWVSGGGWESGGGGKEWGLGGDKQGKDWGSGGGGKPEKDWGAGGDIPRRHYVGLGPGGEWESERGWGSGRGKSEKDWRPREGTPRWHGGGWSRRHSGSKGDWFGHISPSYSPCYIKYNHVPHGHDSWCCDSIQISISPMCWKSESQCIQACRPHRRNHHH